MRILWVNNVAAICGGTLQCTLSMIRAFPECEHHVLALSGRFDSECSRQFGENVTLVTGPRPTTYATENRFDLIVYQNTRIDDVPMQPPHGALSVYYAHSGGAPVATVGERVHKCLIVSEFLRNKFGCDWKVLHQPVIRPPYANRFLVPLRIIRFCTPNPRKWLLSDFMASLKAVDRDGQYDKEFVFVGATDEAKQAIKAEVKSPVEFHPASASAKSLLAGAHVLLHDTTIEETFGRTVREAQRAGCVPVVKRIGGFVEQIPDHAHCGFLCTTPEQFAESCLSVFHDWSRLTDRAREYGDEYGSVARFRNEFIRVITT